MNDSVYGYVDPVMHFLGGAAIVYFLRSAAILLTPRLGTPSALGLDLGSFGIACFIAVVWEFGEWFSDVFLGTDIQRSGGAPLRDLAVGLLGAGAYLVLRRIVPARQTGAEPGVGR